MTGNPQSDFGIREPRCEYLVNPLGLERRFPRLGWKMDSSQRGKRQSAYRIQAASSTGLLEAETPDLWDSGRVESSRSRQIPYAGKPLESRQKVYWRVKVWDEAGHCRHSPAACFSMGLLEENDWLAGWIELNPEAWRRDPEARISSPDTCASPGYFRKSQELSGKIRSATLYLSARGLLRFFLNGNEVSPDIFLPEWTDYNKRIHYRTFDVTELLNPTTNVLSAILGDGWYSGYVGWQEQRGRYGLVNSFVAQLEIEYADGQREVVTTGPDWKCNTGPILSSDFMMGESFDARREEEGWMETRFDDKGWLPVQSSEHPLPQLVPQVSEPVRIVRTLAPVSMRELQPGTWLCDLGQNIAGWVRIRVNEKKGTVITLRHGERLDDEGQLFTENLRRARATDTYTCRGEGTEEWQPSFTFHGFQYFEISGLSKKPGPGDLTGCVVSSSLHQTGVFSCSNEEVNRLWQNGLWSQIDNFLSVPTDCPQRDERLGWMGDAQVFLRTAAFNMDVAAFFTKWMRDVVDAQTEEGIFPDTAPRLPEDESFVGLDGLGGGAGWADAGIIIPWTMWKIYYDQAMVERWWEAMTAWLDYLERTNPDGLRTRELGNNYGDWLCIPSDTSFRTHSPMKNLLATAFWADDAAKMAEMARVLGKDKEADRFTAMFDRVRDAFQKEFVSPEGRMRVETQTAYLVGLSMNLIPGELREQSARFLVDNIRQLETHLSTGFIGIRYLNPVLSAMGHNDVAYELLLKDDYPSWLYPVKHGATTIWERWNAWTEEQGFLDAHMNSFNHYSFGSIGEWLYRYVAGIDFDPAEPGFQRFILKPHPHPSLDWVHCRYEGPYGEIESKWTYKEGKLHWKVAIPANTSAKVMFPAPCEELDGETEAELEAGTYTFSFTGGPS